ncbi:MAG: hypothetical protein V8R40_02460 [Dysosmobacter sp.]
MSKHVQRILSFVVLAALLSCLLPPSAAAAGALPMFPPATGHPPRSPGRWSWGCSRERPPPASAWASP